MTKHKQLILIQVFLMACILACPIMSRAEEQPSEQPYDQTTVFQVSLFNPAQLFPENYNVDDFRFNLIYGVNKDLNGLDLGLVNQTTGYVHSLEFGLVNLVGKNFKGGQFAVITNQVHGSTTGLQMSVFYNDTEEEMSGLQFGLVNHAGSLEGIQIGLLNFNDDTKYMGFFPFINASF